MDLHHIDKMKIEKRDPIDILKTYTKKHQQRDNNKKFYKSELWQKRLAKRKKQQQSEQK